jgi:hypothetical protein
MATYRVTAPMVLLKVKGQTGAPMINSFYAGAIVPDSVSEMDEANLRRHLDRGWVEKLDDAPTEPAGTSAGGPGKPSPSGGGDGVPDGTAEEVRAWVGDDKERAAQALVAEQNRDKPRSTLIDQLTKTAGLAG